MEPKIRLKEFTGSWEEHRLTDVVSLYSGLTYTPGNIREKGTLVLRSSNVQNGEICLTDNVYVVPSVVNCSNVEKGDIIVVVRNGSRALIGKHAQIKTQMDNTVIGAFMTGIKSKCPEFINALLGSSSFDHEVEINLGATINQITNATFHSMKFFFPHEEEQQAIGSFFTSLDSQIKSTFSRLASLRQIKAASLQSMFPQDGKTTPKVRFKGFQKEWKKCKLAECLDIYLERNTEGVYGKEHVLSVSDEEGVVNQIKLLGRSYAGKSVSNYKILRQNQIVYTKSPLKSKPYGIVKVNKGDVGIVSVLYAVYDTKDGICPEYIHYYFDPCYRINKYLLPLVNKGAKNTMNISDEMALQGDFIIPSYDEQLQIAKYFVSLDKQIALQSQRLEKLKQIKSACLDKMFV